MRLAHDMHYAEDSESDVLGQILVSGVNLVIWHRNIAGVIDERSVGGVPGRLDLADPDAQTLAGSLPEHPDLANDIVKLAKLFGRIVGTRHPRVRLERVVDDGCALFHADSLKMRMLCTYAGNGTEWLENENVNWRELGLRGRTLEQANAAIVGDAGSVRCIPTGAVAIFSGRGREDAAPLIHRSSPLGSANGCRLRLCIDLPENCAC